MIAHLRQRARALKREAFTLYLAARHPGTPWYAKLFVATIVAYAFSPIDLIPDFIPVLGYLDDIVLVPLGIMLAVKLIPAEVLEDCRTKAQTAFSQGKPVSAVAAIVIIILWLAIVALGLFWAYRYFHS